MKKKTCPVCGKEPSSADKPFCSSRCATIDLGRWLGEKYVIETQEEPPENNPLSKGEEET